MYLILKSYAWKLFNFSKKNWHFDTLNMNTESMVNSTSKTPYCNVSSTLLHITNDDNFLFYFLMFSYGFQ
jgi:hypothetical protein